jgi:hypothetical protein
MLQESEIHTCETHSIVDIKELPLLCAPALSLCVYLFSSDVDVQSGVLISVVSQFASHHPINQFRTPRVCVGALTLH